MKHILCCLGVVLLLSACGHKNIVQDATIELVKPKHSLTIEKDPTFKGNFPQTLSCRDVFVANDSIMLLYDVVISGNGRCFYKAYSLDDYSYLGGFLREGRGPGEVLSPDLCGTFNQSEGYIFEKMLYQSFSIDISEALAGNNCEIKKISDLPINTIYARPYHDSLQFVINMENDDILFHIIDRNAKKLQTFGLYPEDISAERCLPQLGNSVVINQNKNMAALVMLAIPQINFLNFEDGTVYSVAVDKKYRDWKNILQSATNIPAYMKSTQYYNNAESTPDYIMAVYIDRTIDDIVKGNHDQSSHIHIFNWEGDFLYDLQINENVSKIAYDSNRKFMYGLDTNEGRIYRYNMSHIL